MKKSSTMTQNGFTLIELMVVVTVLGILITLAVPGMKNLIEDNRVSSYTNEFLSSIYLARSEAIKRSTRVTICRSSNGTSCTSGGSKGWEIGWIVYLGGDATGPDATTDVLQHHEELSNSVSLDGNVTDTKDYLSFLQNGSARKWDNTAQSGSLTLGLNSITRSFTLSGVGRVSAPH